MLVYDLEIIKAICKDNEKRLPGIEYCAGFDDFDNMGIATVCCYDFKENRPRVFTATNLSAFFELCSQRNLLVSFNGLSFDNNVLRVHHPDLFRFQEIFHPDRCFDIYAEIKKAVHSTKLYGTNLAAMAKANLNSQGKTGSGALAPVNWQRGHYGEVIDYCLQDAMLTARLLKRIMLQQYLFHPRTGDRIPLRVPEMAVRKYGKQIITGSESA